MIPNTPSLCNNITPRANLDIKDAHSQKEKENKKTCQNIHGLTAVAPLVVMTPRLRKRFPKILRPPKTKSSPLPLAENTATNSHMSDTKTAPKPYLAIFQRDHHDLPQHLGIAARKVPMQTQDARVASSHRTKDLHIAIKDNNLTSRTPAMKVEQAN
jgi:hypothetical protein